MAVPRRTRGTMPRRLATTSAVMLLTGLTSLGFASSANAQDQTSGTITFEKVDASGNLLPGSRWIGESCAAGDGATDWTCEHLDTTAAEPGYNWFEKGIFGAGTTGSGFNDDIQTRGGWSTPIQQCVRLQEESAPAGYVLNTGVLELCKGPGGWTVANAFSSGFSTQTSVPGGWTVINDADLQHTTVRLANQRVAPETVTVTVTETEPAVTTTVTETQTVGAGATATVTVTETLPAVTETNTVTETVTVPGPTVTGSVTLPAETATVTLPAETVTAPATTVTVSGAAVTTTATVTERVTVKETVQANVPVSSTATPVRTAVVDTGVVGDDESVPAWAYGSGLAALLGMGGAFVLGRRSRTD